LGGWRNASRSPIFSPLLYHLSYLPGWQSILTYVFRDINVSGTAPARYGNGGPHQGVVAWAHFLAAIDFLPVRDLVARPG